MGISWPGFAQCSGRYTVPMQKDQIPPELERYLALCERTFERMVKEGTWPWSDSPDFDDVVESEDIKSDNPNSI